MLADENSLTLSQLFLAQSQTPQNCHSCSGDQRHLNQPLHLSVGTDKVQWFLLSGTPIFIELGTFSCWPLRQMSELEKTKVQLLSGSHLGKTVNSMLGLLFIAFSWQTQHEDAPKYPVFSETWNLVTLEPWPGSPFSLIHSSSYTPSILMSLTPYATTYITDMSLCDAPMTSFSILAGSLCTYTLTFEQNTLTQSVSA